MPPKKGVPKGGGRKKISAGFSYQDRHSASASAARGSGGRRKITASFGYQDRQKSGRRGAPTAFSESTQFGGDLPKETSRRVKYRELVGDVVGSDDFSATRYVINPGLAATFPWLSKQAVAWEMYKVHSLSFHYVSRTGTDHPGTIILTPDYSSSDKTPTTEMEATNAQNAVSDVCWTSIGCYLDPKACMGSTVRKQVRQGPIPGDLAIADCGRFYVCSRGETSESLVGALWAEYDIEFFVPRSAEQQLPNVHTATELVDGTGVTLVTDVEEIYPFTAGMIVYDGLNISDDIVAGQFQLPKGVYSLDCGCDINTTSTSGATTFALDIHKSGLTSESPKTRVIEPAASGARRVSLRLSHIVVSDGNTVFGMSVFASAAGTITVPADSAWIIIHVV